MRKFEFRDTFPCSSSAIITAIKARVGQLRYQLEKAGQTPAVFMVDLTINWTTDDPSEITSVDTTDDGKA